jgi:CBS domain-containing protein
MELKNVMSSEIHAVSKGASAEEAAQVMDLFSISFLPVLHEGRAVGTITADDLIRRVVARGLDPGRVRIADVMTPNPVLIFEEQEIEEAALCMRKNQLKQLLVVRHDGTLSGVFTLSDLALIWATADAGEVLRRIAEPRIHAKDRKEHGVAFAS